MSPNRRQRRAFAASESWFRVVPVFRNADGNLEESVQASIIDGELDDCFVIRVPPTTSTAQAKLIEERLTQEMKRPQHRRADPERPSSPHPRRRGARSCGTRG